MVLEIPASGPYHLANVRVHQSLTPDLAAAYDSDGFALADIAVADGRISSITARGRSNTPAGAVDLGGRIVMPCFVDCHTHIDKGHIWPRKPNPDGTFMGALNATGAD
ncbi:MAG: cytosine deaminase, partial [Mesorhizobium sp.]